MVFTKVIQNVIVWCSLGYEEGSFDLLDPFDSGWVENTIQVNCKIAAIFTRISGGNVT